MLFLSDVKQNIRWFEKHVILQTKPGIQHVKILNKTGEHLD